jgi:hypothetical protein
VIVELLHALGCEPLAALGFTAAIDFEGDQWTFFKPSHDDLRELFGLDVQELNIWRPLLDHAAEHLSAGKFICVEVDSFFLPDTAGTDYQTKHVKTSIVLNDLDVAARRLGYFHNAGYYQLEGDDFAQIFNLETPPLLPLFAEVLRKDRLIKRPCAELKILARQLLQKHLARRPIDNPITRFQARFAADLTWLQAQGLETYHLWAFSSLRQLGAAMELLSWHLRWLDEDTFASAAADFERISNSAKAFILKGARAVNSGRPLDASALFGEMISSWDSGMKQLSF